MSTRRVTRTSPPLIDSLFREFAQLHAKIIGQSFHWREKSFWNRKFGITHKNLIKSWIRFEVLEEDSFVIQIAITIDC